jgi:hypothetical protein
VELLLTAKISIGKSHSLSQSDHKQLNKRVSSLWQMRTTEASGCLFSDNFRNFFFTKPTTSGGAEANGCS